MCIRDRDYAKAVKFYDKAVAAADNNLTAPMYLRKAGLAEQAQGNGAKAAAYYEQDVYKRQANNRANYTAAFEAQGGTINDNTMVFPIWWSGQAVAKDAGQPLSLIHISTSP